MTSEMGFPFFFTPEKRAIFKMAAPLGLRCFHISHRLCQNINVFTPISRFIYTTNYASAKPKGKYLTFVGLYATAIVHFPKK